MQERDAPRGPVLTGYGVWYERWLIHRFGPSNTPVACVGQAILTTQ